MLSLIMSPYKQLICAQLYTKEVVQLTHQLMFIPFWSMPQRTAQAREDRDCWLSLSPGVVANEPVLTY